MQKIHLFLMNTNKNNYPSSVSSKARPTRRADGRLRLRLSTRSSSINNRPASTFLSHLSTNITPTSKPNAQTGNVTSIRRQSRANPGIVATRGHDIRAGVTDNTALAVIFTKVHIDRGESFAFEVVVVVVVFVVAVVVILAEGTVRVGLLLLGSGFGEFALLP